LSVIGNCSPEHQRVIAGRQNLPAEIVTALRLAGDANVRALLDSTPAAPETSESGQRWARPRPSGRTARAVPETAAEPAPDLIQPDEERSAAPPPMVDGDGFLALDRPARLALIVDVAERRMKP